MDYQIAVDKLLSHINVELAPRGIQVELVAIDDASVSVRVHSFCRSCLFEERPLLRELAEIFAFALGTPFNVQLAA